MTTGHVFIATSLDGFVAGTDHRMDWLMKQPTGEEDHGFEAFVDSVDGIVMGSNSFRTVLGFDVDWPYTKPVIVVSTSMSAADIPAELAGRVRVTNLEPRALMQSLADEGWSRVYVDGGKLVQSFIRAGLIEDIVLTTVPILIGAGARLFGEIDADIDLELTGSRAFDSGLVQNSYRLRRD